MTEEGWFIYNKENKLLFQLLSDEHEEKIFDQINVYYVDSKGRVWIGGDFGLTLINLKPNQFERYAYFNANEEKDINNSVRGIYTDKENIYANLEMGGLVQIPKDASSNYYKRLLSYSENTIYHINPIKEDYWGRPLVKDKEDYFWIGGRTALIKYEPTTGSTDLFKLEDIEDAIKPSDIWSIFIEEDECLWLGTGNGLFCKKYASDKICLLYTSDAADE